MAKAKKQSLAETRYYNQDDATGFIRLNGLHLKVAAKVHAKK